MGVRLGFRDWDLEFGLRGEGDRKSPPPSDSLPPGEGETRGYALCRFPVGVTRPRVTSPTNPGQVSGPDTHTAQVATTKS